MTDAELLSLLEEVHLSGTSDGDDNHCLIKQNFPMYLDSSFPSVYCFALHFSMKVSHASDSARK